MGRREDEWEQSDGEIAENWEEEMEEPAVTAPLPAPKSKPIPKKTVGREEPVGPLENEAERRLRLETAVKRADLQNAMDLFGVTGEEIDIEGVLKQEVALLSGSGRPTVSTQKSNFDSADPQSIPEMEKFAEYVVSSVNQRLGDRKNYIAFLENVIRRLLQPRDIVEVRRMAGIVQELVTSKQKEQRVAPASNNTQPSAAAAKKKPSLLLGAKKGRDIDITNYNDDDDGYMDDDY